MKQSTFKRGTIKVLAMALALILTLGNLSLLSFAEEVGGGIEGAVIPQGYSSPKFEYQAYYFFATADYETDPNGRLTYHHEPDYWFPKNFDKKVVGKIYSNTLDFEKDLDNFKHAVYIPQADAAGYPDLFQSKKAFSDQLILKLGEVEFDPNNNDEMDSQNVRKAFKKVFEDNGVNTFKITDSNKKEIEFRPADFLNPEYKIRIMRYKRNDTSVKRMHVDMYIERGEAQPITLIEYIDDEKQPEKITQNPKFGDALELGKDNYTIEKVTISVEGESQVTLTPQSGLTVEEQLKNNPIKHDNKKKTVEVWYKTKAESISGGIEVKPAIVEGKEFDKLSKEEQKKFTDLIKFIEGGSEVTKLIAEPKALNTEEKIKISAPEGLSVQKVWIGDVGSGAIEHGTGDENEIYTVSHKADKQVLYVYYNKTKLEFEIIALLPDGSEKKLNSKFYGIYGHDFQIPMDKIPAQITEKYAYAGYTLNTKDGEMRKENPIPGSRITSELKKVYLHFDNKQIEKSTIKLIIFKQGEDAEQKLISMKKGDEFQIPQAPEGYEFKELVVDGEKKDENFTSFTVEKEEHIVQVTFDKKKNIGKIYVIPETLDNRSFTDEELKNTIYRNWNLIQFRINLQNLEYQNLKVLKFIK